VKRKEEEKHAAEEKNVPKKPQLSLPSDKDIIFSMNFFKQIPQLLFLKKAQRTR